MYPISPCENVEYNDFFVKSSYGLGALQRAEQRFQDGVVSSRAWCECDFFSKF